MHKADAAVITVILIINVTGNQYVDMAVGQTTRSKPVFDFAGRYTVADQIQRIGDLAFDGILPEPAVLNNTSRLIAVATFDHYDEKRKGGSIDFRRLTGDYFDLTRIELVKTDYASR